MPTTTLQNRQGSLAKSIASGNWVAKLGSRWYLIKFTFKTANGFVKSGIPVGEVHHMVRDYNTIVRDRIIVHLNAYLGKNSTRSRLDAARKLGIDMVPHDWSKKRDRVSIGS